MNMYVIAGCNGAGKTTASYTVLPEMLGCKEFINSDEIAKGLSPFQPKTVKIEATRIMLNRMHDLIEAGADFAFETTLATKTFADILRKAKAKGYKVTLIFFWLDTPELAIQRVKQRVEMGGHDVPKDVIVRRYNNGINYLSKIYIPISDYWMIIDNSNNPFKLIAEGVEDNQVKIYDKDVYAQIIKDGKMRN